MWTLSEVDHALRRASEAGEVPGVVVAATTEDGIVYEAAFGKREIGKADPMTTDSVFWIASMTKAITCSAAMQLVELGKLELDEPIETLLPQLAGHQVLEASTARRARRGFAPRSARSRCAGCMTHTSGFAYDMWNAKLAAFMERHEYSGRRQLHREGAPPSRSPPIRASE